MPDVSAPLGVPLSSVTFTGGGYCGSAWFGSSTDSTSGILLTKASTLVVPSPVAGCCSGPNVDCGSQTYTAPAGYVIDASNYFWVTGCSTKGTIPSLGITSLKDCTNGKPDVGVPIGTSVASISFTGGGYCGSAWLGSSADESSGILLRRVAADLVVAQPPALYVSPDHEIINGVDVGKLVKVGNQVWIIADYQTKPGITSVPSFCPSGYSIPQKSDFVALLNFIPPASICTGALCQLSTSFFPFRSGFAYVTNTKTYPTSIDGTQASSWVFESVIVTVNADGTITSSLTTTNTYFDTYLTKCIRTNSANSVSILGLPYPNQDYVAGASFTLSVPTNNVAAVQWSLPDGSFSSGLSVKVTVPSPSPTPSGDVEECIALSVKVQRFDGSATTVCLNGYVNVNPLASAIASTWSGSCTSALTKATDLTTQPLSMPANPVLLTGTATLPSGPISSVFQNTFFHFAAATAAISPIATGGAWIAFSNGATSNIFVIQVSTSGVVSPSYFHIGIGHPHDILARPWGFVLLYVDTTKPNRYVLAAYNNNGQLRWQQVIFDNPAASVTDTTVGTPNQLFSVGTGVTFMFNPSSGALAYGRGRVVVLFAHYNWFNAGNVHTGGTCFSVDDSSGLDVRLIWPWGTSHSLTERILYDHAGHILTSTLGDTYPMNIQLESFNLDPNWTSLSASSPTPPPAAQPTATYGNTLVDLIVGNGGGLSYGRLGGLMQLTETTFATTYSRRAGSSNYGGTLFTSTANEFGIVFYNASLAPTNKVVLMSGRTVNNIKSAVYGGLVIIGYVNVVDPQPAATSATIDAFLPNTLTANDQMSIIVVDASGGVVVPSFSVSKSVMSATDIWVALNDGRVAWTFVDASGNLSLVSTPPPNGVHDVAARQTNQLQATGAPTCASSTIQMMEMNNKRDNSNTRTAAAASEKLNALKARIVNEDNQ